MKQLDLGTEKCWALFYPPMTFNFKCFIIYCSGFILQGFRQDIFFLMILKNAKRSELYGEYFL